MPDQHNELLARPGRWQLPLKDLPRSPLDAMIDSPQRGAWG
jgi:hypothetical protein